MKTSHYVYGLIVIVLVILLVAFTGNKRTAVPAPNQTSSEPSTQAGVGSPSPAVISGVYHIHVKRGGPTVWYSSPTTTVSSEIQLSNPPANSTAVSPMSVSGQARGSWFSEATMPILLTDASGRILARGSVRAQSDWMTDGFVPFLGSLSFARQPTGTTGVFVISNDDPSGDPAQAKHVEVLVTFN
jgi:hypothetical protein